MTISSRSVAYREGETRYTGFLAWREAAGCQPGVLLIHGGAGLDDHARDQAQRYAALGYAVLAADMFGPGVAGDRERTVATITALRDNPSRLVEVGLAAVKALADQPEVDVCVAAVGFCFGGMAALTLARGGVELAGVVSMHGGLTTKQPAEPGKLLARVLACHGALDPHVPMADVSVFVDEMNRAQADYQVIVYGGAMHGFTHRHAVPGAVPGVEYHEATDRRSFAAARSFLDELVASSRPS